MVLSITAQKLIYSVLHNGAIYNCFKIKAARCETGYWVNKMWYIHTMEYYSALKKNDLLIRATSWMTCKNMANEKKIQIQRSHAITKLYKSFFSFISYSAVEQTLGLADAFPLSVFSKTFIQFFINFIYYWRGMCLIRGGWHMCHSICVGSGDSFVASVLCSHLMWIQGLNSGLQACLVNTFAC